MSIKKYEEEKLESTVSMVKKLIIMENMLLEKLEFNIIKEAAIQSEPLKLAPIDCGFFYIVRCIITNLFDFIRS